MEASEAMHPPEKTKAAARRRDFARRLIRAALIALWFVVLTFPLAGMRLSDGEIILRWKNIAVIYMLSFAAALVWRKLLAMRGGAKPPPQGRGENNNSSSQTKTATSSPGWGAAANAFREKLRTDPRYGRVAMGGLFAALLVFPFVFSAYQVSILTTALMYVALGLGLNIVVGLAGLLDLGYVAFYAVGAYSYALAHQYWGLGFWSVLPAAGALAALFGIVLGIPVLRLRGDYLAIVTLGFGEIIRLILENWSEVTQGPRGIADIPKPALGAAGGWIKKIGGVSDFEASQIGMYFIVALMILITIVVVHRLDNSRIGRAWLALREDELACRAMGIDTTATKLRAFALGACWAGFIGAMFAAKTSFVNPASFVFHQSAIILCIVVLGGMGSILGVVIAALLLTLIPEYLREFSDYRMLVFGALMVLMMVFRPGGLIGNTRPRYRK
jgi:branched-chain amino acid transport system permease protein